MVEIKTQINFKYTGKDKFLIGKVDNIYSLIIQCLADGLKDFNLSAEIVQAKSVNIKSLRKVKLK